MKLNEIVSKHYNCRFPARYNLPAIEYYRTHSEGTQCLFIFDNMIEHNDFTLCDDDIKFMHDLLVAPKAWSELLEAFLYVAYEDVKEKGRKPKDLKIIFDD